MAGPIELEQDPSRHDCHACTVTTAGRHKHVCECGSIRDPGWLKSCATSDERAAGRLRGLRNKLLLDAGQAAGDATIPVTSLAEVALAAAMCDLAAKTTAKEK